MALTAALLGLQGVGTAVEIFGVLQQAKTERGLLKLQAQEAQIKSDLLGEIFESDLELTRAQQIQRRGAFAAKFGASGVRVQEGSAMETVLSQARIDEINNSRAKFQTQLAQRELQQEQNLAKFRSKVVKRNAKIQVASSAISGVAGALSILG